MTTHHIDRGSLPVPGSAQRHRLVMWIVLSVFAALLAYFGFRGYLNPDLLFHFANALYC